MKNKKEIDKQGVNEIIYLSKNILKLLFIILIIGIILGAVIIFRETGVFAFFGKVLSVLAPLFIGFVIAWLLSPLVEKMSGKKMSRVTASIIVFAIFIVFLVILFRIFIPLIYHEINELIATLPSITGKISDFINGIFSHFDGDTFDIDMIRNNVLSSITSIGNNISSNLPATIVTYMSNIVSTLGSFLFGLIIGLYMLIDFKNIKNFLLKLIPDKYETDATNLLNNIGTEVRKCVNGTLLVACLVFVLDTVGFAVIGMESALLFGLFCGITDLIPFIGPWIGTAIVTIVALTQSPLMGIGVLIIAVIVQIVESYILQPIVMSKATSLHPVTIICGLLIFGAFWGIIGMILATPIMSIIKVIWKFIDNKFHIFERAGLES